MWPVCGAGSVMRGGAPPFPHAVAVLPPLPANHNQNHNHNHHHHHHHHHQHYYDHHHHQPQNPQGESADCLACLEFLSFAWSELFLVELFTL